MNMTKHARAAVRMYALLGLAIMPHYFFLGGCHAAQRVLLDTATDANHKLCGTLVRYAVYASPSSGVSSLPLAPR